MVQMKRTVFFGFLCVFSLNSQSIAQTPQSIIDKVNKKQEAARDISFRVKGKIAAEEINDQVDFIVKSIPKKDIVRLQFMAPDSLADNVFIYDKKELRQYLFLTNQIIISSADSMTDNLGGITLTDVGNTTDMLKGYQLKLLGKKKTGSAFIYHISATSKKSDGKLHLWITSNGWRPTRIQFFSEKEGKKPTVDLNIIKYKENSGLNVKSLKKLPKNAQIIRQ